MLPLQPQNEEAVQLGGLDARVGLDAMLTDTTSATEVDMLATVLQMVVDTTVTTEVDMLETVVDMAVAA